MLKRATFGALLVLAALSSAQQENTAAQDDTIIETPTNPTEGMEMPAPEEDTATGTTAPSPPQQDATSPQQEPSPPASSASPAPAAPSSPEPTEALPQHTSPDGAEPKETPAAATQQNVPSPSPQPEREVTSVPPARDWVNKEVKPDNQRPVVPPAGAVRMLQQQDSHVVSQSRMFSVSGAEALRVGAIATHADELRGQVIGLLGMGNSWRHPISIRLYGHHTDAPVSHPIRLSVQVIGDKPTFQIRVHCGGGVQLEKLNKAIITMVLYEFSLRELSGDEMPDTVELPEWLISGLYQAILNRSGKLDRRLYQNLFERAEMLSPGDIIETAEPWKLDAASRQVYEISCGVLVLTLINRPGGQDQLRELVRTAALADNTPKELIKQHFAELGVDQNELTKWWALELAAFSAPRGNDYLSPLESDKALSEALTMQYFDQKTGRVRPVDLDNPYELAKLDDWQQQSRPNVELLMELCRRCFPSYRPVITEYLRALHVLGNGGSPDEVQQIIGPQLELRTRFMSTAIRARDYLDWYEITTSGKLDSQSLDRYMDTVRELRREIPGPRTHLDLYLEDIETLYSLKANDDVPAHLKPAGEATSPAQP